MTIRETVLDYLKNEPKFRERSNKNKGIVNLLARRWGALGLMMKKGEISHATMVAIIEDASSMDRQWRQILEHDETLRGSDYKDKQRVEEEAELALGYVPGHHQDIKKLRTL